MAGAAARPGSKTPEAGRLRERKKRLMRRQLSDTATRLFMERGFDTVRVTEIAEACGVSEKTVFNYFPTRESLILDRPEAAIASLRVVPSVAPKPSHSPPAVFKSVRSSRPVTTATCIAESQGRLAKQDHAAYIPRRPTRSSPA